jgi:hypothetical protein
MNTEISTFVKDYAKAIKENRASLFIGSGLSRPAGYVGWKDILRDCAIELGLDVDKEEKNLITLAEYYHINKRQRTTITQTIKEFFDDSKGRLTTTHRLISTLPITSIWTTNYDRLLERAYKAANLPYTVITDDDSYREINRNAEIVIHKMHGDVTNADKCVITRKDYEQFELDHEVVLAELKGEMCSNSFLFLGYSFSDTDIQQHILSRIRLIASDRQPQKHYCILEKINRDNYDTEDDYKYARKKQSYHISDMQAYGLNVVLVDSYEQISEILSRISQQVLLKNVFISGSYDDEYQYAKRCSDVAFKIAYELIQGDYQIYTGYGQNIGSDIVAGAFRGCCDVEKDVKDFNDNVHLFPFPYKMPQSEERVKLYHHMRVNMISNTQIMIVIGGMKIDIKSGVRVISDGIIEEAKIAQIQGVVIIPLSSTGGAAMTVYDELMKSDLWYVKTESFKKLKTENSADGLWKLIKDIIEQHIARVAKL